MVEKKPAMVETGASSTDRLRPGLMSAWGQTRTFGDGTQCPLCLAPRKQTWLNALRVAAQDRGNRGEKQRRPSASRAPRRSRNQPPRAIATADAWWRPYTCDPTTTPGG